MADNIGNAGNRRLAALALLLAALVFLAIYLPAVGRAFYKDDFAWIYQNRLRDTGDFFSLFRRAHGFYRPLVALSFSLDYGLFGLRPRGYGLTNLAILLAAAVTLFFLARRLGCSAGAAAFAAFLWLYNHHGINMALLWISGRTSLMLSLFALLAALALLSGRRWLAALFCLLALFCKEDALLLPPALFLILLARGSVARPYWRPALRAAWPLTTALAAYLMLRLQTTAFLPFTAPAYYRFDLQPLHIAANTLSYLDRSTTFTLFVLGLLALLLAKIPRPDSERRVLRAGLIWFACGLGLIVFVPVRSSLYAVYPGIGVALCGAALAQSLWRGSVRHGRALVAACVIPFLLYPVLTVRNSRWSRDAGISLKSVSGLVSQRRQLQTAGFLVLEDRSPGGRELFSVFGTLVQEAVRLCSGNDGLRVWLEPPPEDWEMSGLAPPPPGTQVLRLVWQDGRFQEGMDTGLSIGSAPPSAPQKK